MHRLRSSLPLLALFALYACGGGGGSNSSVGTDPTPVSCSGSCATATSVLTTSDVERVIAQGVFEAQARRVRRDDRRRRSCRQRTCGVPDSGARRRQKYWWRPDRMPAGGSDDQSAVSKESCLPIDAAAAIAKAVTGAYLSSEGNAFSSRVRVADRAGRTSIPARRTSRRGRCSACSFRSSPCSDFITAFNGVAPDAGPKRSPLGLSADPGGFPLYKDGTVVGGVGVLADDLYSVDADITNVDSSIDEAVAYAATFGFSAPLDRRGDRITVDGKTLRFSDVDFGGLADQAAECAGILAR